MGRLLRWLLRRFERLYSWTNRIWFRLALGMGFLVVVSVISNYAVFAWLLERWHRGLSPADQAVIDRLIDSPNRFYDPDTFGVLEVGIGFLVCGFIGLIIALVLARRIAKPLETVSQAAAKVAQGDFSVRVAPRPGWVNWWARLRNQLRKGDETLLLAQNFNRMAEALEHLEAERRFTSAAIAHELRTPLTILRGRLEAIRYGIAQADETEIERMLGQIDLLTRLTNDMRTLSLAEAGQLTLHPAEVKLAELVQTVAEGFQGRAADKQIRLELDLDGSSLRVKADPERMMQVVGNLLENALRHTPGGGTVTLRLRRHESTVQILVKDSGPGVPPEALPHLFERFYRADTSRSRSGGGSGLGLAIVRVLVGLHGGTVRADNAKEGGAEFRITLPLSV